MSIIPSRHLFFRVGWFSFLLLFIPFSVLASGIGPVGQAGTPEAAPPTATPFPVWSPPQMPGFLEITNRQLTPDPILPGEEAQVSFQLVAEGDPACLGIPARPADIFVVFDISTSAGNGPTSNWEHTLALTQAWLEQVSRPVYRTPLSAPETSQVGLISSRTGTRGPEPILLQTLTSDYMLLHSEVSSLVPSGDTDIAAGLRMAADELGKSTDDRAKAILLMLHDNVVGNESTLAALDEVKKQFPVFIVINNLNLEAEQQISAELAIQLAPPENVFVDPQPQDLRVLFVRSTGATSYLAAVVHLDESLIPADGVRISEVFSGSMLGGKATWDLAIAQGDRLTLGYKFRALNSLGVQTTLIWLDCNGYIQTTPLSGFDQIQTENGPVPSVTADHPVGVIQTPTPQPLTGQEEESDIGDVSKRPKWAVPGLPGNWGIPLFSLLPWLPDWLWLLLLLLLLLFLLWLLWRWWRSRRRAKPTIHLPPAPPPKALPPIKLVEKKEFGEQLTADWHIEKMVDRADKPVRLMSRKQERENEPARVLPGELKGMRLHTFQIRIKEEDGREIGEADLSVYKLQPSGVMSSDKAILLGYVDTFNIANKKDLERGVADLILDRLEKIARSINVKEIMAPQDNENLVRLFAERGYQASATSSGSPNAVKTL